MWFLVYTLLVAGVSSGGTWLVMNTRLRVEQEEHSWTKRQLDTAIDGIENMRKYVQHYDKMRETVKHYQIQLNALVTGRSGRGRRRSVAAR